MATFLANEINTDGDITVTKMHVQIMKSLKKFKVFEDIFSET